MEPLSFKAAMEVFKKTGVNFQKPIRTKMRVLLRRFLKEGWVQVGENIPVFFKYTPDEPEYPFFIVYTVDSYGQYEIYDEWVEKGILTEEDINFEGVVRAGFNHVYATNKTFHQAILTCIEAHYACLYTRDGLQKREEYDEIQSIPKLKLRGG
jgi:hypothetical protein